MNFAPANTLTLDKNDYYTVEQFAEFTGVAPATLTKWRLKRQGPEFLKMGREIWYPKCDVLKWLETRKRNVNREEVRQVGLSVQRTGQRVSRFNGPTGHARQSR